jgi:hypothetical protein
MARNPTPPQFAQQSFVSSLFLLNRFPASRI